MYNTLYIHLTWQNEPWIVGEHIFGDESNATVGMDGLLVDVLSRLEKLCNFRYTVHQDSTYSRDAGYMYDDIVWQITEGVRIHITYI